MKAFNFKWHFIELCYLGSNWQYVIIGLDNGLAPNRRQAIIWTNDGLVNWCIYVSLGLNELSSHFKTKRISTFFLNRCDRLLFLHDHLQEKKPQH